MKSQFWRLPPQLRLRDIALTLGPALLWLGAIYARPYTLAPYCAAQPERCTTAQLLEMDRPAVALEAGHADGLSFTTQGLSGVVALAAPACWHAGRLAMGVATPLGALAAIGVDLAIFAQTAAWNGLLTETAHLVGRPRPFVYVDPGRARDFSNYTSFYSGHTSFSAAASTSVVLTLAARGAPAWVVAGAAAGAYALMSLTGLYRVLAGRHFPTDVLCGALAGVIVAFVVAAMHKRR